MNINNEQQQSIGFWSATKSLFSLIGSGLKTAADGMDGLASSTQQWAEEQTRALKLSRLKHWQITHQDGSEVTNHDLAEALLKAIDAKQTNTLNALAEAFSLDLTGYRERQVMLLKTHELLEKMK